MESVQPRDHQSLLDGATRGDAQALEELFERHLPLLRGYVRRHAGARRLERESAGDIVQSVCREVLLDLPRFEYRGEEAFRRWFLTAALNKIRARARYYRAQRRD